MVYSLFRLQNWKTGGKGMHFQVFTFSLKRYFSSSLHAFVFFCLYL